MTDIDTKLETLIIADIMNIITYEFDNVWISFLSFCKKKYQNGMTKVDDTTEFQGSFTHPNATRPVIHRLYDHNEYIKVNKGCYYNLLFSYRGARTQ